MSTDTDVERLRVLVAELDRLLTGPSQLAAVDADGFPSPVASGELIESAWGNAVVDKLRGPGRIVSIGSAASADIVVTTGTNDVLVVGAGTTYPYAVNVNVAGVVYFGYATVANVNGVPDAVRIGGPAFFTAPGMIQATVPSTMVGGPIIGGFMAAPGTTTQYKARITISNLASGPCHALAYMQTIITTA